MTIKADPRVLVALDYPSAEPALEFARRVRPDLCRLKVGKELFVTAGPAFVEQLIAMGYDVFLDLKFHDIPNTVAQACKAAAKLGVWMVNVKASDGRRMMAAGAGGLGKRVERPLLIGVTWVTRLGTDELAEMGLPEPAVQVERLARLAQSSGLDGVVCSAQESSLLKAACGKEFKLITPGIRPADASLDDQTRVMTPAAAMAAGSGYLGIGRPIPQNADPVATLISINQSIA